MTDWHIQKMIDDFAQHGDTYTPHQWDLFFYLLSHHELEKCADYWKWKAGIDDDDAD